ncbi:MAG: peptidase [Symploca sp. SIO2G7]|nr:peptidase [Symploca sp. SIO2G7]
MTYQLVSGYTQFELPLYFQMLFGEHGPYYYLTAVLALFTQVITGHRYAGMGLTVLISLIHIPLNALGLYHNLYRWAATNDIEYSLMNGYGHLFTGHLWYSLYWGIVGGILMLIAYILWPRGRRQRWKPAWSLASGHIKKILAALVITWAAVGSWIIYNTAIVNAYQPPGKEQTAAEIERRFKQYESLPMPVVTHTQLAIELYPDQRYFQAEGEYQLENRTDQPINEIHLLTFINLTLGEVTYPGATLREAHPEWGYYIYDLATPLLPGEQQTLKFITKTNPPRGFQNHVDSDDVYMIYPNDVVGNGTNLYSPFILPFIGYTKMVEHKKAWLRARLDLPPLEDRMRPHDDPTGLAQAMMLTHLGWGTTDITIGTAAEQIPVSTGQLVDRWTDNGRNYARYRSQPSRGKFTIYSGDYAVHRDNSYRVPIEIYYHPQHSDNIELITQHVGQALTFYEDTFGPYPFDQVRVVEFVYYDGMVFSEGGTLGIPEVLVWKSQARGLGEDHIIDWVTYLLAQAWWEDQLIAADVAGSMTLREALSAYASNLYLRSQRTPMQQEQAQKQRMRDFFRSLGKIDFKEPPLTDIYNELPIARHKGGMVLELIEDQIGQDALLKGIRAFLQKYRYQSAPYATVLDLQDAILAQASDVNQQTTIRELFSQVVTYQVGLADALYTPRSDGKFDIRLTLEAQKFKASGLGQQQPMPLNLPVTIRLVDQKNNPIYVFKPRLTQAQTILTFITEQPPAYAEIDPAYRLPSGYLQDNTKHFRLNRTQTPTVESKF